MGSKRLVFTGHIAGFGTGIGVRMVVGTWTASPLGAFTDVMVQTADDQRILLAPSADVAEFVGATYHFDRFTIGDITAELSGHQLAVTAPGLDLAVSIGGPAPLDRLLRLVPGPLAIAPWWLRAVNPIAARILPGVRTAGSAGNGRREFYGVRRSRRLTAATGSFRGSDLAGLAPLLPPVSFGFSSAPTLPQIVAVTTTIDLPVSADGV